jgi:hypothetical protein
MIIQGYEISGRMPMFTAENRQKNRGGIKTMTRRLRGLAYINEHPEEWKVIRKLQREEPCLDGTISEFPGATDNSWIALKDERGIFDMGYMILSCPYSQPGQYRVMTEPLMNDQGCAFYKDDFDSSRDDEICLAVRDARNGSVIRWRWKKDVLSSLFMPMEAARHVFLIADIKVERLGDISPEDAISEGLSRISKDGGRTWKYGFADKDGMPGTDDIGWPWHEWRISPIDAYDKIWCSIHGADSFERDKDKWAWIILYKAVAPRGRGR